MEITGRLTADAQVSKTNSGKEVVNFSIAINDNYKPKGASETVEVVTYINCSYWLNAKTAQYLKKAAIVQVSGRIGLSVYANSEGKPMGSLNFHVNSLKILAFAKTGEKANVLPVQQSGEQPKDDLPF